MMFFIGILLQFWLVFVNQQQNDDWM